MIEYELNTGEAEAVFERLARKLSNLEPVMQDLGELFVESTKERFKEGKAPDGTPWAPKSQATLDHYARGEDPVDFRPLFGPSGRLSKEIHSQADAQGVSWGSSLIYAAVMQFGATAGQFGAHIGKDSLGRDHFHSTPWGDIPARPFIGLSNDDQTNMIATIEEWLEDANLSRD